MVKQSLLAIRNTETTAPPHQHDAGIEIRIHHQSESNASSETRLHKLQIVAKKADRLEVWLENQKLGQAALNSALPYFELNFLSAEIGNRLLVVRAFSGGKLIGYRAATVALD
jgi:hypothetical protein